MSQQMEGGMDKDCSALGMLFQTIINDMRGSSVIWEDFTSKAAKLHSSLKATLAAIGGFLDAFQKVADMATGSRGATKEIGTALTRLCLRHKSIETKLKTLTSTIVDNLVTPLQDKSEDWKKTVAQLDKEHAKEYKKARQEIKKCATDTMRLQKKVKKGKSDMQNKLEHAMKEVTDKYLLLEEAEKTAVRTALIEERGRFCLFISCLRPFVEHEIGLLTEITHLQDITHNLCLMAGDPQVLPASSEQVIMDLKGSDSSSFFSNLSGQSPPSSPSSIGSRKSSMCSINSINSSSSGSVQSHSPSHHVRNSNSLQLPVGIRLQSGSSQDSGFTSQDTLFQRPATPSSLNIRQKDIDSVSLGNQSDNVDSSSSTPSDHTPSASSTWTNWPNPPSANKNGTNNRPHTISTAYEKNHNRPALTAELFERPPQESAEDEQVQMRPSNRKTRSIEESPYARPSSASINKMQPMLPPLAPKPKIKAVAPPKIPMTDHEPPAYVNLTDLANMERQREQSTDSDRTPTDKSPPDTQPVQSLPIDVEEAMRDLDHCTAALHTEFETVELRKGNKRKQNSMELAKAIQELEASTAALQSTYDSNTSQHSLQCSSGYGTMNNTPASSQDTIATGEYDISKKTSEKEKYFTMPRNSEIANVYKAVLQARRPASTAGVLTSGGLGRRSSMNQSQNKPPPPVRRSSSITTANPAVLQKLRKTPPREQPPIPQVKPSSHRRSSSSGSQPEPAYAELQEIQQSIQARQTMHGNMYASTTITAQNVHPQMSSHYVPPNQPVYGHAPQYTGQQRPPSQDDIVHKLNERFAAMNASLLEDLPPPPPTDIFTDPDLPPPPSVEELQQIESVFSHPEPPVYTKSHTNSSDNLRSSLVSELKSGPILRRVSSKDEGSEC